MSTTFRKTSIRSRRRTLGIAAIGLFVEFAANQPPIRVKTMMTELAALSKRAGAYAMAAISGRHISVEPNTNRAEAAASRCPRARLAEI